MERLAIAEALRTIGALLTLEGAPRYRSDAYVRGARAVEATKDVARLAREGRLEELPGIGPALAAQIDELLATGRTSLLDRLEAAMPPGARALAPVATLSQIQRLHAGLGVTSIAELEAACVEGRVRNVKGFGAATEAKLLQKIRAFHDRTPALRFKAARAAAQRIADHVRGQASVRVEIVGDVRRGEELVEHVEILAIADPVGCLDAALAFERMAEVIGHERPAADRVSARLVDGTRATLHLASPREAGNALVRTTGPCAHVEAIAAAVDGAFADEGALYAALGCVAPPPEIRDLPDVLARARRPIRLVELGDIRGAVHCHSDWSDGKHSILEMARAADTLGLEYITITDHSPTASYAGGVELERLYRQWDAIDEAQAQTRVRILRGTESDILADGALDYPDHVLERFDIVIASIHNRYAQGEDAMTRRLVRAMRHPIQKVWGHPLGRLLLRRPPVPCRLDDVLDAIIESGAIIELNGDPYRMDLGADPARRAHARGATCFIASVDAHAQDELRNIDNSVTLARRVGLGPDAVLNTRGVEDFLALVHPTRGRARLLREASATGDSSAASG